MASAEMAQLAHRAGLAGQRIHSAVGYVGVIGGDVFDFLNGRGYVGLVRDPFCAKVGSGRVALGGGHFGNGAVG